LQILHRLAGPASRQPGQAEIGQAGGWPIGRAGRLTSLKKDVPHYKPCPLTSLSRRIFSFKVERNRYFKTL
jgi:hypothetical protein